VPLWENRSASSFVVANQRASLASASDSDMQFRIQFLDGNASVILDLIADARNAAGAIALVADLDWPPHAVTMRMLYVDGREVHSAIREHVASQSRRLKGEML
jgi:hypothetical protein